MFLIQLLFYLCTYKRYQIGQQKQTTNTSFKLQKVTRNVDAMWTEGNAFECLFLVIRSGTSSYAICERKYPPNQHKQRMQETDSKIASLCSEWI